MAWGDSKRDLLIAENAGMKKEIELGFMWIRGIIMPPLSNI